MPEGTIQVVLVGAKGLENTDFFSKIPLRLSSFPPNS
jgi:hypothetical protein